jgi:hydrogenase nickel incorporation protein HypA/HybF
MHEEVLARDLRRKLLEIGAAQGVRRIVAVRLWVGGLSHLSEDWLRSHWQELAAGTPAEFSRLEVETSEDLADPRALGVVLQHVEVEEDTPTDATAGGGTRRAAQ